MKPAGEVISAPDQDTKCCEVCGTGFQRGSGENRARFAARRYCGRACMGVARRTKPRKPTRDTLPAAAPELRIVGGVWRPSAPGWPDQPVIPSRRAGAAS